ncbi:hypothetical protein D3C80_1378650 [compost metagenome]
MTAKLVDPEVAQDAEHPGVETRALLEPLRTGKCLFTGCLHKVVGKIARAAKRDGKAAQVRQEGDEALAKGDVLIGHFTFLPALRVHAGE